jgi:cyclic AMP-dependent transcription factor ATF-4
LPSFSLHPAELQSITNKIDLPINDFVASIENAGDFNIEGSKSEQLLLDFNSIFDAVENELTPPQSPPELYAPSVQEIQQQYSPNNIPAVNGQYELFNNYQPVLQQQQALSPPAEQFIYIQNASPTVAAPSPGNEIAILYENSNQSSMLSGDEIIFDPDSIISSPADIQRELEVVDELVRAHSRHNSDYDDDASVSASSVWSPRSEYSSSGYSQYSEVRVKKSSSGLKGVTKKRSRGYGRNPEEKKSRKKEQNKNAATRYRIKKKQEVEVIMDEEKILMDKNKRLSTAYKDTKREVKYLKSLLRDLFKARGFI